MAIAFPHLPAETHVNFFFKDSQATHDLSAANCPEKFSLLVNNETVEISKNEFLKNIVALFTQTVQQTNFPLSQFADEVWFKTTDIKICNNMMSVSSLAVSSGVFQGTKYIQLSIPSHTVLLNCKSKIQPLSRPIGEKLESYETSCILQFQRYMSMDYNTMMRNIKNTYDTQPINTKQRHQYYVSVCANPFIFMSGGMIQAAIAHELGHIVQQEDPRKLSLLYYRIQLAKLYQIILAITTPIFCSINWYCALVFYPIFSTIAISALIFSTIAIIICEYQKIANYHFLRKTEENADAYVATFPALKDFAAMQYKIACATDYFYAMAYPKWFAKIREAINYLYRTHPTNEQRYRFFAN